MRRIIFAAAAFLALAACGSPVIADGTGDRGLGVGTRITPAASDFADSLQATSVTIANHTGWRTNALASLRLSVGVGTRTLVVGSINNLVGITTTSDLSFGIWVDGAWYQAKAPTASGWQTFAVGLDGSAHTVEIVSPYQEMQFSTPGNINGCWVQSVDAYGGTIAVALPTATRRLAIYGDSLDCTGSANPGTRDGWIPRLRTVYPGRISVEAWGGRALWDDTAPPTGKWGFGDLAALADRLVALNAGAVVREYLFDIGTNDETSPRSTAAVYGSNLGVLIDAVHTRDPGGVFYVKTLLTTTLEATPNANGEFPSTFRTAATTAATGRGFTITIIPGPNLTTASCLVDFAHYNSSGHAAIFDGSGPCASSTNMRAVFGI